MNEPHDPSRTVDVPSSPADSLDAGLAAGFGPPRSSLGDMRPVLLKDADGDSAHVVKPSSDAMPPPEQAGGRYRLYGEIARGGIGAVLRGRDVDLGRDLAVKVLLEKHANRPDVARRFLEEAQVGAQLQHPGVVPVYDIGRFGERPFFTMKLVKGQTLTALLSDRTDPTADRPRFLAITLQVAQALAYAHAKGVIHRDLKPANVMVGAFGEVQVMDWGLAKVLQEGGIADEERAGSRGRERPEDVATIRTVRSSGSAGSFGTDTEAGSLLGTPAYMPPEQANGDVAHIDRRADVFGLGAILCEVLTGKPPYVGRSSEEVRRKAANGNLGEAHARLDGCGADQELIVLTRTCLSPEAIDRPKDAQAVAEGLTAYLDSVQERLRQAELAQAEAKAKAVEEAKRRRLTLALAATVLLAVSLGGGGWLWWKTDRDTRRARRTSDVNGALNQAAVLRERAKAASTGGAAWFAQAREQAQRALALVENGPADAALAGQVRQLQAELDEEEKDRKLVAALNEALLAQAELEPGGNWIAEERALPLFREAFAAYGLPAGEGEPDVAAQRIRKRPPVIREAILAALYEWEVIAGHPDIGVIEPHLEWLRAVLRTGEGDEGWTRKIRTARQQKDPASRRAALERLAAADVGKLPAMVLMRLAGALEAAQAPASAEKLLRLAQERYPADFWINHQLGDLLSRLTPPRLDEAIRFQTAAVALSPESPLAHNNLGTSLGKKDRLADAIACYEKAIELNPKCVMAYNNLGLVMKRQGKVDEAIACFKKAIALAPGDPRGHNELGAILCDDQRDYNGAISSFRKAIALDPKFAGAYYNLGNALSGQGKVEEAIAFYREAIALAPELTGAHTNLGLALKGKGQVDEAIACYQKAIDLDPKLAAPHLNLGVALKGKGQVDEAIACFRKGIELAPKDAEAHNHLGNALSAKGQVDEAIACFQKAIVLDPKYAKAHNSLGTALAGKGQVDEAIASYRQAIKLDPKYAGPHNNLGLALSGQGKVDEAIACFTKAIALDPKAPVSHTNLGLALVRKGQVDEAIACWRRAIALDPKHAAAQTSLGTALVGQGKVEEAIACFRKAIDLDPNDAFAHNGLGNALLGQGKVEEAIACFRKAIEFDPKHANAHYNLGNALKKTGQWDAAIASYQKAIALEPKHAEAHCNLGGVLQQQGRFAESLAALQRGHELGSKRPGWPYPSAGWVRQAKRLAALEGQLPALLKGEYQPKDPAERQGLAGVCQAKKLYRAAAGLYAEAFAAEPQRADGVQLGNRYDAAAAAIQAGSGQGNDAPRDEAERVRLRARALAWLRDHLAFTSGHLTAGAAAARADVRRWLRFWQTDAALARVRDPAALDKLPAQERAAWQKLWADVAALLKQAEAPPKKEGKR